MHKNGNIKTSPEKERKIYFIIQLFINQFFISVSVPPVDRYE